MLRGPAGRSGDDAEDEVGSERLGVEGRGSRSLFAVFLERAIRRMEVRDNGEA
jgi:hypothetical protein